MVANGILAFTTNDAVGWDSYIHNRQGHVGLADGSVQRFSTSRLREAVHYTDFATNRLAMP